MRFCRKFHVPVQDVARPLQEAPKLIVVQAFLLFQARKKKGRLDEEISLRTLQKYWTELRLEVKRQSGHSYALKKIQDMDNAHDEYEYQHPRMRLQLTLAILILHYLGLRPRELVESSAYRGTNEGLLWKDLDILAFPDQRGQARFVVQPKIRNRKNRRDREDLEYVASA
ncbi:hypothetical protein LTR27_010494 [Elasticomyces elasticus]|nr:hypothetical protein LTR27_010494 [Elasticomyces elasticus]